MKLVMKIETNVNVNEKISTHFIKEGLPTSLWSSMGDSFPMELEVYSAQFDNGVFELTVAPDEDPCVALGALEFAVRNMSKWVLDKTQESEGPLSQEDKESCMLSAYFKGNSIPILKPEPIWA